MILSSKFSLASASRLGCRVCVWLLVIIPALELAARSVDEGDKNFEAPRVLFMIAVALLTMHCLGGFFKAGHFIYTCFEPGFLITCGISLAVRAGSLPVQHLHSHLYQHYIPIALLLGYVALVIWDGSGTIGVIPLLTFTTLDSIALLISFLALKFIWATLEDIVHFFFTLYSYVAEIFKGEGIPDTNLEIMEYILMTGLAFGFFICVVFITALFSNEVSVIYVDGGYNVRFSSIVQVMFILSGSHRPVRPTIENIKAPRGPGRNPVVQHRPGCSTDSVRDFGHSSTTVDSSQMSLHLTSSTWEYGVSSRCSSYNPVCPTSTSRDSDHSSTTQDGSQ